MTDFNGSDPPGSSPLLTPSRWWFVAIVVAYAGVVLASVLYGTPARLPGVALGFPLLLHLERAAAVVGAIGAVLVVAILTRHGYLPSQLGNIGYPAIGRQHELERRVAELQQQLDERLVPLEEGMQTTDEALPPVQVKLTQLDGQIDGLARRVDNLEIKPTDF